MKYSLLSTTEKKIYDSATRDLIKKIQKLKPENDLKQKEGFAKTQPIKVKPGASFGKFIQARRLQAGITQNELAKALGYESPQFFSNIERDRSPFPLEKMPELCKMLNISKAEIKEVLIRRYALRVDEAFANWE